MDIDPLRGMKGSYKNADPAYKHLDTKEKKGAFSRMFGKKQEERKK